MPDLIESDESLDARSTDARWKLDELLRRSRSLRGTLELAGGEDDEREGVLCAEGEGGATVTERGLDELETVADFRSALLLILKRLASIGPKI